jgi:peptidyl-prolyl cis-trans isomerase D
VETTGEFTPSAPDPKLKADPQLNQAAFKLTQQEPNSDPIQVSDGYAVLHLAGVSDSRPLTLDEAKQKIVDSIKTERSRDLATAKGRQAAETLRNGLKNKQPLLSTLEQAGALKAEKLEPFTLADDIDAQNSATKQKSESVEMMVVKNVAGMLQPGEVSEFSPAIDGGVIVILDKREPPDPAKYQESKAKYEERYLKTAREYVFMEWLRDRQRDAGLQFARG